MTKKLLIIDDEISIHSALEFITRQYDIKVLNATTAKEAFDVLKKETPDLILMDFKLPGINGIEITKRIKSSARFKEVPIIGITAYASEENIKIAKEHGIISVLEKPFELIDIQKIFNQYLL